MSIRPQERESHSIAAQSFPPVAWPPEVAGPAAWSSYGPPLSNYTALIAVDIVGFGDPHRDEGIQRHLRRLMYGHMEAAFAVTGIPWAACHREDRGDGILIVTPSAVTPYLLLDPLAHHLYAVLRHGNRLTSPSASLRLRAAVHAGIVQCDAYGVLGGAVNHLFRLLEAEAFKKAMHMADTEMAMIVSGRLYGDVVEAGCPVAQDSYRPIRVTCKETCADAWMWLPPGRHDWSGIQA